MRKAFWFASVFGAAASIAPAAALAQNVTEIEEVVVTAQRFAETAQKTPLIITALAGDDLSGVTDVRQLQTVTPGIAIGGAGNITQTFIRGVGSQNATGIQESAVAYNADGVFLFTPTMISPMMYDLERIEILKGPQGTLYGRNASGGVVNVITEGASLERVEGYVEGEVGSFDLRRVVGAVNIPLSDTLAVRLAAQHAEHSGYLSDGTDDQDITSARVRVLWAPTSDVTVKFGVDGATGDSLGAGSSFNPNPTGDDWIGALDPRVASAGLPTLGGTILLSAPPNPPPYFKIDQWSVFGQLDVDLGFATLTVLPAYRHEDYGESTYLPGYNYIENIETNQKSFEVRLANQTDRLRWVVGAYYFKADLDADIRLRQELIGQGGPGTNDRTVESYAAFGETTFNVADNLRLIVGLRYTHEQTKVLATSDAVLPPSTPAFRPGVESGDYISSSDTEGEAVTWKIGAEMDLTPDSMLFATVSRGFKGGGAYTDVPGADSSFDPEYLTAYELGSRNRFLGNSLQVNGEIFYWEYKDQQVPYVGFNSQIPPRVTLITANAGEATMYGANLDVTWKATANDSFHFGVEYLKAEYDSFLLNIPPVGAGLFIPRTTACKVTGVVVDCSGLPSLRAPEWSGLASYEHRFDLGNDSDITFSVDATYASKRYIVPTYTPETLQKGQAQFNASLTYNTSGGDLSVSGWVKNIGDERIMSGGGQILMPFFFRPTLLPPRTYGVTVRKSF